MDADTAVALLSTRLGTTFDVVGPMAGGETGATEVRTRDGRRHVMKWELDPNGQDRRRQGAVLAERLRVDAGWPSPSQVVVDVEECLVVLQEFMVGSNVEHMSHELVDTLFALHDARVGIAPDADPWPWAAEMVEVLVSGGRNYCLHQPLRDFDPRTRRVVERIEEIGNALRPGDLVGFDIVHGDLHPGNLLQLDGRLTAIVDMDFTSVGDARFDLTMLAVGSLGVSVDRGVRSRLFERGVDALPEPMRHAYTANLLLRNLDWPIRKHRHEEVEFWLAEAERLLPDE